VIHLKQLSLVRGEQCLFRAVDLSFFDHAKVGLVGANGSGKSSLFALLLSQLSPTDGEIAYPKSLRFSWVEQEFSGLDQTVLDYVLAGDTAYFRLHQGLRVAEQAHDHERLAHIHHALSEMDGYAMPAKAARLLSGLGFETADSARAVSEFSGGWRMRLSLARALIAPSDVLLLDEPTNHLDPEGIVWLEDWLQKYPGLLLLISHDRMFLDNTVTQIAAIEQGSITLYGGNYSFYEQSYAQQQALQQATYIKQQKNIQHLQSFVDRFRYKATKARQAQSRLKMIERLDTVAAVQASTPFQFSFEAPGRCPSPLIVFDKASLGYEGKVSLSDLSLQLMPGDRIGLLGVNGAGKSTFIKGLCEQLAPLAGEVQVARGVRFGYFAQHQLETLDGRMTALEQLQRLAPDTREQVLRSFLGGFGFRQSNALKRVHAFSGGEKSRLVLAMLVWQRPNVLLLDEPTNHLDMGMRQALTLALQSFEGAMVLVSHDRFLVNSTVDQLWLVQDGHCRMYAGTLDDYYRQVIETKKRAPVAGAATKATKQPASKSKANPMALKLAEEKIEALAASLQAVEESLSCPCINSKKNFRLS
jgi:ATP-binding cassette subfamily F protein 3